MKESQQAARKLLTEMLGEKFADSIESAAREGYGAPLAQLALDYAFAGVWSRPGLDRRSRSLVTMGILISSGQAHELKNHIRAALANGITPAEIEEVIVHSGVYVGLPGAGIAMTAAIEVLRELGKLSGTALTSQERGLT